MNCKGCGTEIPAGLCLREIGEDIVIDVFPEGGDDGPWCGDCAESEGQARVDARIAELAASGALRGVKQLIVIRSDLKMRRGKEIAQGAHAAMAFLSHAVQESIATGCPVDLTEAERFWIEGNFKKVTCRVRSEEELRDVAHRARQAGLHVQEITDAGLTEFDGVPTFTCIAIGPDWEDLFEGVTDELETY